MSIGEGRPSYPLWLSRKERLQLKAWHDAGKIYDFGSCGVKGRDEQGVLRGIEFVRVTANEGLAVETAMRAQQFPLTFCDLLDEILFIQLMQRVRRYLDGKEQLEPLSAIYKRVGEFRQRYRMAGSHWISRTGEEAALAS